MPNSQKRIAAPSGQSRSSNRLGIVFFSAYFALYSLFVYAFIVRALTEQEDIGGETNTAIVYGVILIVVSFALAILYGALKRRETSTTSHRSE